MCLMPLNCTLKTVKMVNFTLCIFCYSKKFKDQDYILTQNKMFRNVQNFQVPLDSLIHQPPFSKK